MVMLRHDLPTAAPGEERSWHIDWMLALEPEAESPLLSFRLEQSLLELPLGAALIAERIQDHRTAYLTYEGSISGNRGTVTRLAEGGVLNCREIAGGLEVDLRWRSPGDLAEEMKVSVHPIENTGKYQVKILVTATSCRYNGEGG